MSLSPSRLVKLGLSPSEAAGYLGLTLETCERLLQDDEDRAARVLSPVRPGKMMTRLLLRPEMDNWETRKADR